VIVTVEGRPVATCATEPTGAPVTVSVSRIVKVCGHEGVTVGAAGVPPPHADANTIANQHEDRTTMDRITRRAAPGEQEPHDGTRIAIRFCPE
jgi:hypothetical protein